MEEKIISETQTNLQIAKGRKETRENKVRDIGDKKIFFKKILTKIEKEMKVLERNIKDM